MSETTTEQPSEQPAESSESTEQTPPRHVPIAEHVEERKRRQAAEQIAADFKKRLDEIEAANLSDLEKAQKQAQEAQEAAAKATADAARFRIAAKYGISDEDADLFLHGSDAETLERQAAALVARTPTGPKPDLSQGAKGNAGAKTTADSFTEFFRNNLSER